jgi:hypothetical protein
MNLQKRQNHTTSLHYLGWTAGPFFLCLPVEGEPFLLTSPFIERGNRTSCGVLLRAIVGFPTNRELAAWAGSRSPVICSLLFVGCR